MPRGPLNVFGAIRERGPRDLRTFLVGAEAAAVGAVRDAANDLIAERESGTNRCGGPTALARRLSSGSDAMPNLSGEPEPQAPSGVLW